MVSDRHHRLFVAIPLPSSLEEAIEPFRSSLPEVRGLRATAAANLHVTAFFLGDLASEWTDPIALEVADIAQDTAVFELKPRAFVFRGKPTHPSMIWLEFFQSAAFRALHDRLRAALERYQPVRNAFQDPIPHITLARVRGGVDVRTEIVLPTKVPDGFIVDRIGLWRTHSTPDGVRYERLNECELKK